MFWPRQCGVGARDISVVGLTARDCNSPKASQTISAAMTSHFQVPGAWIEDDVAGNSTYTACASASRTEETANAPSTPKPLGSPEVEGATLPRDSRPPHSLSRHSTIELQGSLCDACKEKGGSRYYCNICQYTYCSSCWDTQLPHREQPSQPGQLLHEKTDVRLADQIRQALRPDPSDEDNALKHCRDERAAWFGLNTDSPQLGDSGRFEELMSAYKPSEKSRLHPSLVSFIGQTGSGKSGLINLLISLAADEDSDEEKPVVGSIRAKPGPTSGDVHLYQDPKSARDSAETHSAILYADCEGLQGGDSQPLSRTSVQDSTPVYKTSDVHSADVGGFSKFVRGRFRTLEGWLGRKGRQYIVENLYSRVLYTFSDVVVFVLTAENKNIIENVTLQLLEWASTAIDSSSNQPCLPHAIVVLNKSSPSLPDSEWDSQTSTEWLFAGLNRHLPNNPKFSQYVDRVRSGHGHWQVSAQQLLECFYTTIQVVRIPELADGARRPNLISQQMTLLYDKLADGCTDARRRKEMRRMLLTADQFSPYVQWAFDHFSTEAGFKAGFDFIRASFLIRPVSPSLTDNIFTLARALLPIQQSVRLEDYFEDLSKPVASALMLDATRNHRKGAAEDIFPQYVEACNNALGKIMSHLWPCAEQYCTNRKAGHSKGHQSQNGEVFGMNKPYRPALDLLEQEQKPIFQRLIRDELNDLLGRVLSTKRRRGMEADELSEAREIHRHVMFEFYRKKSAKPEQSAVFMDNIGCLLCLLGLAAYALPCGHVVCGECVQSYGQPISPTSFMLEKCPIHEHRKWRQPVEIRFKPDLAGVRVLSIDGGGVRGITQLSILVDLERELQNIPIQCFFDLAIGTSIGGIIALGLFVREWSVDDCMRRLKALCKECFTHRWLSPTVSWILGLGSHRYQTNPLEQALLREFGEHRLFGDKALAAHDSPYDTKVAITAASASGGSFTLANYNRLQPATSLGTFFRMGRPEDEFKLWEVARATSAAPTWFEQYRHKPSGRIFLDGGLYHNNPIQVAETERKQIWPKSNLDLVVSLGAGHDEVSMEALPADSDVKDGNNSIVNLAKVAFDKLWSSLDSQRTWKDYIHMVPDDYLPRYVRLNTTLSSPLPELDAVGEMNNLENTAESFWAMKANGKLIQTLAKRMVASSFYLEVIEKGSDDVGSSLVKGYVRCRIDTSRHPEALQRLGKYFEEQTRAANGERPAFRISRSPDTQCGVYPISAEIVKKMRERFELTTEPIQIERGGDNSLTEITLSFNGDQSTQFPISGFPCCLFG